MSTFRDSVETPRKIERLEALQVYCLLLTKWQSLVENTGDTSHTLGVLLSAKHFYDHLFI